MTDSRLSKFELTRRWFLKGVGVTAGAATLSPGARGQALVSPAAGLEVLGRGAREITLRINGQDRPVSVEPRTTLLAALRDGLGLTGAKEICGRGSCGGCTVLVDGTAECSCMSLAMDAEGHEISTVEGLSDDSGSAAFIQSMIDNDAAQCGFCIPGFVMKARELLNSNPNPSPQEVRESLSGNICRCGTHSKIFEAILAVTGQAPERPVNNDQAWENESPRIEVRDKLLGAAKYTADIQRPNMVHAKYIRFPFGAGRITDTNLEAARGVPGVIEVELYENRREARFPGDRVGHVVGLSIDAVEDGIEALNLEWRRGDVRAKMREFYDGVPALNDEQQRQLDEVLGQAATIVEAEYSTEVQTHSCLETHGCVVDHHGDSADAWGSTQACVGFREGLQGPCELDASQIVFDCTHVGGGFGSKFSPGPTGSLAARLSKRLGRPVRVMQDRREEHWDGGNRPGSIQHMKIAASEDGRLLGGRIHCVSSVGFQEGGGGVTNPMIYRFGEVQRTESEIRLSSGLPTPFRAPGKPQGCFGVESMMDEIADALGMDPLEFRDVNDPSATRAKQREQGAALIGWERRQPSGSQSGRIRTGLGVGCAHWFAFGSRCQVDIDVHRSGHVETRCAIQDIGTGSRTLLRDIVSEALAVHHSQVTSKVGMSTYPPGPASGGSVTSRLVSCAAQDAARNAINALKAEVADAWNIAPAAVRHERDSRFYADDHPDGMSWGEACQLLRDDHVSVRGEFNDEFDGNRGDAEDATSATQFAEVEVDTETGVIRVKKIVALQACGQPVNRHTVENQIYGGVIQGLSFALFEDRILDGPTGAMINPNLEWYKIAGPMDIPDIVPVIHPNEWDTGVRSIGEPATIPTSAAIANAVANALGVRVRSLPMTPARVLEALERGGRS